MINTTIFKSAFIVMVVISHSAMSKPAAAVEPDQLDILQSSKPSTEETPAITGDHYDQRQNGTKNFRLHIDGVFLVVAPAEALLLAGELDPSLLALGQAGIGDPLKSGTGKSELRKPEITEEGQKPIKQKSAHGHALRLSNLLGPILRSFSP